MVTALKGKKTSTVQSRSPPVRGCTMQRQETELGIKIAIFKKGDYMASAKAPGSRSSLGKGSNDGRNVLNSHLGSRIHARHLYKGRNIRLPLEL